MLSEIKAIAILALLAGLLFGVKAAISAHDRRAVAAVRAQYVQAAADELKRASAAQAEISNEAQRMAARARSDRDLVPAALDGLQHRAAIGGGLRPASTAGSAPAADAGMVPAELLGRVGELAERLAGLADERGIAGNACERAYQALTPVK